MSFPYTHYSCPCTNVSTPPDIHGNDKPPSPAAGTAADEEEDETTFDPHSARADFALYPLEHLLFCNECHEIRCQRCYFEEVLYYFCPQCLFEVPSTTVKTETNRCQRSCFQCPICIAPLQLQAFVPADDQRALKPDQPASRDGPFILSCAFCAWSTLEIGIKFDKSVNVSSQLARLKNGGQPVKSLPDPRQSFPPDAVVTDEDAPQQEEDETEKAPESDAEHFARLASFYKSELADSSSGGGLASSLGLDSPSHLSRLLTTYGVSGLKRQRGKPQPMREAASALEGFQPATDTLDDALVSALSSAGWTGTTSLTQRSQQTDSPAARLTSDARPIAMPLRSKRAKRCRTCRHNLIRPDDKRQSTKFKIRLLAGNFVPRVSIAPLDAAALDLAALRPGRTAQFLLTLRNPLFDPVKIHLATPGTTPGPVASRVTILCPTFDIGASADVWDDALATGDAKDKERRRARDPSAAGANDAQPPEAGKVWERGRNWTSVIVEVVPGRASDDDDDEGAARKLEVPVLVRLEYYTDNSGSDLPSSPESPTYKSTQEERVPRELQFWVVLGLGRIASGPAAGPGAA